MQGAQDVVRLKTIADTLNLLIKTIEIKGVSELQLALKHARRCALQAIEERSMGKNERQI